MTIQKGGLAIWNNRTQVFVSKHHKNESGKADSKLLNELGFICNDINNTCNTNDPNVRFNLIKFYNPRLAGKEERVFSQVVSNGELYTFYSIYEYIWFYRNAHHKLENIKYYIDKCINARIIASLKFRPDKNDNHTIIGSFTLYLYYKVELLLRLIHYARIPHRFLDDNAIRDAFFNIDNKILDDLIIVYIDLVDCHYLYGTHQSNLSKRCYEYLNSKINFYLSIEWRENENVNYYSGPDMNTMNNIKTKHKNLVGGNGKSNSNSKSKKSMKKGKKKKTGRKSRNKNKTKRKKIS